MPAGMAPPIPQLDAPPPSPDAVSAGGAPQSFAGLGPQAEPEAPGGMQQITLLLQTTQAVAQGLDILGKMQPSLSGLVSQMQEMLRTGVRSALQQGPAGSEPAASASPTFTGMGGAV